MVTGKLTIRVLLRSEVGRLLRSPRSPSFIRYTSLLSDRMRSATILPTPLGLNEWDECRCHLRALAFLLLNFKQSKETLLSRSIVVFPFRSKRFWKKRMFIKMWDTFEGMDSRHQKDKKKYVYIRDIYMVWLSNYKHYVCIEWDGERARK